MLGYTAKAIVVVPVTLLLTSIVHGLLHSISIPVSPKTTAGFLLGVIGSYLWRNCRVTIDNVEY